MGTPVGSQSSSSTNYDCIVVGGGPAGVMFAYLAARAGLTVILLEAYHDFNRQFRGDTLNPLAMGLLDELGLMPEILALPHGRVESIQTSNKDGFEISYSRLPTKYPYVMILSQPIFLDFIVEKAKQYPGFSLQMSARVNGLIEEAGAIKGVTYRDGSGGLHELRSKLVVGCDGRASAVRKLAAINSIALSEQPDDVVWFKMPLREADSGDGLVSRQNENDSIFMFRRPIEGEWQAGLTIIRGDYKQIREGDIDTFRNRLIALLPEYKDRLQELTWNDTTLLKVELSRAEQWYRDGLLLIGDAAHIMSPMGGVGINLAIRDAVIAANILIEPLKQGPVTVDQLAKVQRKVEWDIKLTQNFQVFTQNQSKKKQDPDAPKSSFGKSIAKVMFGIPLLRDLPVRILSFGLVPVHVNASLLRAAPPVKPSAVPAAAAEGQVRQSNS